MNTPPPGRLELAGIRRFHGANRFVEFAATCAMIRLPEGSAGAVDASRALERITAAFGSKPAEVQRLRRAVEAARIVGDEKALRARAALLGLAALAGALTQWLLELEPLEIRVIANRSRADECLLACADDPAQDPPAALKLAARLIEAVLAGEIDHRASREALADAARRLAVAARGRHLDQTMKLLVARARERGIPWWRPSPLTRVVYFGEGAHAHPYFESASDLSPIPSRNLAFDKRVTAQLLHTLGLPGVVHRDAASVEDALAIAEDIGWPVVVKPSGGGKGIGVTVGVADAAQLREAFARARESSASPVLVERFVPGDDHRLLVVGGRLIAAARRLPAQVTGDGTRTVAELVDIVNSDPRRGEGFESPLVRVTIDDEALRVLASRGLAPGSIPAAGERVVLRGMANVSQGGTAEDVTKIVHPDNRWMAETIAEAMRFDVTGIDFLTPDISRSWKDVGGGVCEVNAIPGFRPHLLAGPPASTIADAILGLRIPEGADGRVPTVAVTGSSGKTTVCRLVTRILETRGLVTGLACSDGLWVGGHRVRAGDCAGGAGPAALRLNPRVQAAVYETARGGLARYGVPFDACDVAVLLNVNADHVGSDGIDSIDEMARLKSLILPLARRGVVLNADDARCRAAGRRFAASRTAWFSLAAPDDFVASAIGAGARAAWLEGESLVLSDAGQRTPIGTLADFPLAHGGRSRHNVANLLAAVAVGAMLGSETDAIARALRQATPADVPGRQSVFEIGDSTLVLDRADSATDLHALARFVDAIATGRPKTLVFTCPGNRADEQVRDMARAAAGRFDRYVAYSWRQLRGRPPESVPGLLATALAESRTAASSITVEPDQERAFELATRRFGRGQVLAVTSMDLHDAREVDALRARLAAGRSVADRDGPDAAPPGAPPGLSAPSART